MSPDATKKVYITEGYYVVESPKAVVHVRVSILPHDPIDMDNRTFQELQDKAKDVEPDIQRSFIMDVPADADPIRAISHAGTGVPPADDSANVPHVVAAGLVKNDPRFIMLNMSDGACAMLPVEQLSRILDHSKSVIDKREAALKFN